MQIIEILALLTGGLVVGVVAAYGLMWLKKPAELPLTEPAITFSKRDGRVALLALGTRLVLLALGALTYCLLVEPDSLRNIFSIWDATHYIELARDGYPIVGDGAVRIAFYPFYPMVVRAFSVLTLGDTFWSAMLVSNLAYMVSCVLFDRLTRMEGERNLWQTLFFICVPFSFFFALPFSEGLFVAIVLGICYLLRRGKYGWAGVLGMLAALTKNQGVVTAALFAGEALYMLCQGDRKRSLRIALSALWVAVGFLLYLGLNAVLFGDPLHFLDVQQDKWSHTFQPFWHVVGECFEYGKDLATAEDFMIWIPETVGFFLFAGLVILAAVRKVRPTYVIFSAAILWVAYSPSFLLSGLRYMLPAFAMPMALGKLEGRKRTVLLVASAVLLLFVNGLYCYRTLIF